MEVAWVTKSFALLSESSPFPAVSSLPPAAMDSLVERELALRSMLPFDAGFVGNTLVSKSSDPAPNPTLSTRVVPASL